MSKDQCETDERDARLENVGESSSQEVPKYLVKDSEKLGPYSMVQKISKVYRENLTPSIPATIFKCLVFLERLVGYLFR